MMYVSLLPVFPYEIFDLIVDYFGSHPDYKRDLITLGNVSTAFSHMRQRHLFWEVMLDESCPEQYAQLEELMASNPRISTLPRRLVIHKSRLGSSFDAPSSPSPRANIYLQFPNINELAILGRPRESYRTGAENVGRNTSLSLQALHRMVDNGCLTSLTLLRILDLPIILILSQPNLVHLHLRACIAAAWHESPPSPAVQAAGFKLKTCTLSGRLKYTVTLALLYCRSLESLTVRSTRFLLDDADVPRYHIPPATFASLRDIHGRVTTDWRAFSCIAERQNPFTSAFPNVNSVTLHMHHSDHLRQNMGRELFGHLQNIEQLHLLGLDALPHHSAYFPDLKICLPRFQFRLRVIHLRFEIDRYTPYMFNSYFGCLTTIKRSNVLETMVIGINFRPPHLDESVAMPDVNADFVQTWRTLDALLMADRLDFPNLRYVEICICLPLRRRCLPLFRNQNSPIMGWEARCQVDWKKGDYEHVLDDALKRLRTVNDRNLEVCCAVYVI